MNPPTDYIHQTERLARKTRPEAAMARSPQPNTEFYKTPKALAEVATGLELVSARG